MPSLSPWKWLLHDPGTKTFCNPFKAPVVPLLLVPMRMTVFTHWGVRGVLDGPSEFWLASKHRLVSSRTGVRAAECLKSCPLPLHGSSCGGKERVWEQGSGNKLGGAI